MFRIQRQMPPDLLHGMPTVFTIDLSEPLKHQFLLWINELSVSRDSQAFLNMLSYTCKGKSHDACCENMRVLMQVTGNHILTTQTMTIVLLIATHSSVLLRGQPMLAAVTRGLLTGVKTLRVVLWEQT